jgi:hypothetical protein
VTVSVDANGNLTTDPLAPNVGTAPAGQKYVYDAANRVTEIWRTNVASNRAGPFRAGPKCRRPAVSASSVIRESCKGMVTVDG